MADRGRATHVLGHSMGGILALALAAREPGRFQRVGLAGLPVFDSRAQAVSGLRRRSPLRRVALVNDRAAHAGCAACRALGLLWKAPLGALAPRARRDHLLALFEHTADSHRGGLADVVFAGRTRQLAAAVTTPVAALHGGRDTVAPLAPVRELAAAFGWDLRVAPNASHQVILERPVLTARWVREHLLARVTEVTSPASVSPYPLH